LHRSCQEFEQVKDPCPATTWDWPGFLNNLREFRVWDVSVPIPEPECAFSLRRLRRISSATSGDTPSGRDQPRRKLTTKRSTEKNSSGVHGWKGHRIKSRTAVDAFNNGQATVIIMMENNTAS